MIDYQKKIEKGVILYLKEHYDVDAITASIGETEVERGYFNGCETCGYGADEDTISFSLYFTTRESKWTQSRTISGSSINFLPIILPYIDRANEALT